MLWHFHGAFYGFVSKFTSFEARVERAKAETREVAGGIRHQKPDACVPLEIPSVLIACEHSLIKYAKRPLLYPPIPFRKTPRKLTLSEVALQTSLGESPKKRVTPLLPDSSSNSSSCSGRGCRCSSSCSPYRTPGNRNTCLARMGKGVLLPPQTRFRTECAGYHILPRIRVSVSELGSFQTTRDRVRVFAESVARDEVSSFIF